MLGLIYHKDRGMTFLDFFGGNGLHTMGGRFLVSTDIPREAQPEELVQGGQAGHRGTICNHEMS